MKEVTIFQVYLKVQEERLNQKNMRKFSLFIENLSKKQIKVIKDNEKDIRYIK